ncbi:hypothetical protein T4D_6124 [Trichinella pseudospiralis]|uniref:Uncharacterized protein n=1 Tax=Trichinella pseudospiralis TaxID=6337 RepID=A0A0V1FZN2_TRIPS|nr:hypothetical protein T4D_6124 [Trichinella pseudospiralis]
MKNSTRKNKAHYHLQNETYNILISNTVNIVIENASSIVPVRSATICLDKQVMLECGANAFHRSSFCMQFILFEVKILSTSLCIRDDSLLTYIVGPRCVI